MQRVSSVVSTKWLSDMLKLNSTNLTVLDGSWQMPSTKRDPYKEFKEKHIPTAQFFGIDECKDKSTVMDHMIPKPEEFSAYVGQLGIDNDTHVVVYDYSDLGIFSAQRVWWTFRVFGHSMVSVLDGGMTKWLKDGYGVTSEITPVIPKTFHPRFRKRLVKDYDEILNNISEKSFLVVDARAKGRFDGTAPEPREGISSGHFPGAINLPFTELLDSESKTLKSPEELKLIFEKSGLDLNSPLVASCGTGISGCMLALAAHQLGKEDFAVYDGSWTEFVQRAPKKYIIKRE